MLPLMPSLHTIDLMDPLHASDPRFILASASPRRRELTQALGLRPVVMASHIDERRAPDEPPQSYCERLATEKARAVAHSSEAAEEGAPRWILAADTVVVLGDRVLEKPDDEADAERMLARLSGTTHEVITSFCWLHRSSQTWRTRSVTTRVRFRDLDARTIAQYVATGEPMDKAGAYGIQGIGGALVAHIEGSYSAVVGLPVAEVIEVLDDLGGLGVYPFVEGRS